MKRQTLQALREARATKTPVALLTRLEDGHQSLIFADGVQGEELDGDTLKLARQQLARDTSAPLDTPAGRVFVQVFNPPLRLLLVGAVHISQFLAPMARMAGYEVTVIDPREVFASDSRFPDIQLTDEWPDKALTRLDPDRRTAVVTLTHDPKLDDPALQVALRSAAFYVGSLGSRKTHAGRCERLQQAGYTTIEIGRIHAPVGLAIGARSPAEIAISILAQITQVLRNPP